MMRLPDGCDTESIQTADQVASRHRLGLPLHDPIVGYVGVITKCESHMLIAAIAHLRRSCPKVRLPNFGVSIAETGHSVSALFRGCYQIR
jgi:hypothetical protein